MTEIQSIPIDQLSPDPANARKHPQRNIETIVASLRRFGQQKPIVIDSSNIVRAGNGTLAAAKKLGWTHIQAVRSDLAGLELTAFAIADNRTAELAEWDTEVLSQMADQMSLADLGFDEKELAKLLGTDLMKGEDELASLTQAYEVVIECQDEEEQKQIFERLTAEGLKCRLFTL